MASTDLPPLPDFRADYERRRATGQIGWAKVPRGARSPWWDLTPYNSKSFDDNPSVVPIYDCPTCGGTGHVDETKPDDEPYHHGWWKWKNGAEMVWVCSKRCSHPDHDEEGG